MHFPSHPLSLSKQSAILVKLLKVRLNLDHDDLNEQQLRGRSVKQKTFDNLKVHDQLSNDDFTLRAEHRVRETCYDRHMLHRREDLHQLGEDRPRMSNRLHLDDRCRRSARHSIHFR